MTGLRVVLAGAGLVALLLPWPTPESLAGFATALGAGALVLAVRRPGSIGPLLVMAAAVVSWLSVPSPGLVRTVAFAAAVFAVHAAAALAAAIPPGAGVDPRLPRRQAARSAGVFGGGCLLVAPTALLSGLPGSAWLTVLGIVAAGSLLLLPLLLTRPPRAAQESTS